MIAAPKKLKFKAIPTPLERYEQQDYFAWLPYCPRYDGIRISDHAFAIPNGTKLYGKSKSERAMRGRSLVLQGVKAGIEDVMILIPVEPYHGLILEFKRLAGAPPTESQIEWHAKHRQMGYYVGVPYGFEQAKAMTLEYFKLD